MSRPADYCADLSFRKVFVDNRNKVLHKSTFDIELDSEYRIEFNGYNDVYKFLFNGKLICETKLTQKIKYFTSNSNFNIIYN